MRDHDAIGHRFYWIVLIPFACSAERSSTNTDNAVIEWSQAALQGIRDTHLGAPMMARALAILHTCMYDAWAAYDGHASMQNGQSARHHRRTQMGVANAL